MSRKTEDSYLLFLPEDYKNELKNTLKEFNDLKGTSVSMKDVILAGLYLSTGKKSKILKAELNKETIAFVKYSNGIDTGEIKRKQNKIGLSRRGKIYGIGYCSTDLKASINGKVTKEYKAWHNMLQRSYDQKYKKKHPSYEDVTVCTEWHDYQNFYTWYQENYYEVDGERVELDKDILVPGNKAYSPSTCSFVPKSINLLLNDRGRSRGDYPQGVTFSKKSKKYKARLRIDGKQKYIGLSNTPDDAFSSYKSSKEQEIKRKATQYKSVLPKAAYDALMRYDV